jgi:hypothetical protein
VPSSGVLGRVSSGASRPPVSLWASYGRWLSIGRQRARPRQVRCVKGFREWGWPVRRARCRRGYASSSTRAWPAGPARHERRLTRDPGRVPCVAGHPQCVDVGRLLAMVSDQSAEEPVRWPHACRTGMVRRDDLARRGSAPGVSVAPTRL